MAAVQQYDIPGQLDRGNLWLTFLASKTELATYALAELNKRNYSGKKDDKGKVLVEDHGARGAQLYANFKASEQTRAGARPNRKKQVDASEAQADALRQWVRDHHAELLGLKRNGFAMQLSALPTLQELLTLGGLRTSATEMVSFLGSKAVQPVLLPFNLSAEDAKVGQALLDAWDLARGTANAERGHETGATKTNISDREAFIDWLGMWWAIAKVRFKDRPDILAALGVELGTLRRGGGGGSASNGNGGNGTPA